MAYDMEKKAAFDRASTATLVATPRLPLTEGLSVREGLENLLNRDLLGLRDLAHELEMQADGLMASLLPPRPEDGETAGEYCPTSSVLEDLFRATAAIKSRLLRVNEKLRSITLAVS